MQKIPLFKIYTDKADVKAVTDVIKSGRYWAIGPSIEAFEKALADYVGVKYALAFNSGTSALHALMLAYEFGSGDEIIVPSFTFIATVNSPLFVGAKPVFVEIEDKTFGLDPAKIEEKITPKTKAIMVVHYGGGACQIEAIQKIAKKHNLILIEDTAQSLGVRARDKKVGTFGDSAVLSFCQNKIVTTGEGGAIVTDNKDLFEKLKLIRSHGRQESANYFASSEYMDYVGLGYNFRMSTMTAALGLTQLKKIGKVIALRRKNAAYLDKKLSGLAEIILPGAPKEYFHIYQMYTIVVKAGREKRDALKKHLNEKGVMAKIFFQPIHLTTFYQKKHGYKKGDLPITEAISDSVLSLPMYPGLTKKEMDYMTQAIKKFFKNA